MKRFGLAIILLFHATCAKGPSTQPKPWFELVGEWGEKGDGPGKLNLPLSLATDATGLIYVADAGTGLVNKFDPEGKPLISFGKDLLMRPTGITVNDPSGTVYVADYAADLVIVFSLSGERLGQIRGGPNLSFNGCVGVAVDGKGNLFVLEFDGHRIQKFDSKDRFKKTWGSEGTGPGQLHFPVDLAIGPDGFLYVADTHNRRVQKFTRDGDFIAAWGSPGTASDQMDDITGIAVSENYVYLADSGNHRLQVWSLEGVHERTENFGGLFNSEMETPTDVALERQHELLLLHPAGPRIMRYKLGF